MPTVGISGDHAYGRHLGNAKHFQHRLFTPVSGPLTSGALPNFVPITPRVAPSLRHEIRRPRHFCDLALILPPYLGCDDRVRCRCGLGLALPTFKHCARWPTARRAVCGRGRAWASRRRGGSPGRVRCSRPARRACRRRRRGCSGPGPGAFRGGPTRGARAAAAHGGRWASRGCGGSPGRVRRSRPADPAPVRLALHTPVCPCCVRAVLVRFVVGVCVLKGPCLLRVPVLCSGCAHSCWACGALV